MARERYIAPVGFAREPAKERRRWIGRFILALFVVAIGLLLYTRVIHPTDNPTGPVVQSTLPAPG